MPGLEVAGGGRAPPRAGAVAARPQPRPEAEPAPAPPAGGRALRTLVFTDIVDSTGHVARLGDSGWRDLLRRHDELLRGLTEEHRGRLAGKAGDGLFVSSGSPRAALAWAAEACPAVDPLGLRLRVGLHTGDCELLDDSLVGMAVH